VTTAAQGAQSVGSVGYRRAGLDAMLDFAEASRTAAGFAWLDDAGRPMPEQQLQIWITARMTYVFSLASLLGRPGADALAAHGVHSLMTSFRDDEHGGWFHTVTFDGTRPIDPTKSCYDHAFVLMCASTAVVARVPGAEALLGEAVEIHERHFWDQAAGACRESWSADWAELEPYRGINSNMHVVEAYLAVADATGDQVWRDRAARIVGLATGVAADHDWRLPEHYDDAWQPVLDYNVDRPRDPFRPFGSTPGHGFEWARLIVQLEGTLPAGSPALVASAEALFDRAVADTADGRALLYTTDWQGLPIVREQFHWVLCEAILAADALARRTGASRYAELCATWWQLADAHFVDAELGSWRHELDEEQALSRTTWHGRPDAYHVVNALLLPDLPLAPTAAAALHATVGSLPAASPLT